MRALILAAALLVPIAAAAQAPHPGSGGGGNVGASVSHPTQPTGKPAPGAPSAQSAQDRAKRDAAGQRVIGRTGTPNTSVPGATGGKETGTK